MPARLEHVNITVGDVNRSAELIRRIFGWSIRWTGPSADGGRTVHIGTEQQYLALYSPAEADGRPFDWSKGKPLNHVAIEVDDLLEAERRVIQAGLEPFGHGDYEPGRRFYFFDRDGIEFEVVSYADA